MSVLDPGLTFEFHISVFGLWSYVFCRLQETSPYLVKHMAMPCYIMNEMSDVLGHCSALKGYTGPGSTWANEMNFVINHVPCAGLIALPVDQQPTLPLCYGCPNGLTIYFINEYSDCLYWASILNSIFQSLFVRLVYTVGYNRQTRLW